jgi:sugar fermentation stimulation protein A
VGADGGPGEETGIQVPFVVELRPGVFLARPNRFLCRVLLYGPTGSPMGDPVEAHLPDPGRLKELLVPGRRVRVEAAANPDRRTQWTLRLVESPDRSNRPDRENWISLDTTLPNRLVAKGLQGGLLEEFAGWELVRPEVTRGGSRFDFLLAQDLDPGEVGSGDGNSGDGGFGDAGSPYARSRGELLLEVKSVTLVEGGLALFPDAVTARGRRHVEELTEIVREGGQAAILFVAQREDVREIRAAAAIDPAFARALETAVQAGVRVLGRRCRVDPQGIELLGPVPAGPG